jgi:hypothetical protein
MPTVRRRLFTALSVLSLVLGAVLWVWSEFDSPTVRYEQPHRKETSTGWLYTNIWWLRTEPGDIVLYRILDQHPERYFYMVPRRAHVRIWHEPVDRGVVRQFQSIRLARSDGGEYHERFGFWVIRHDVMHDSYGATDPWGGVISREVRVPIWSLLVISGLLSALHALTLLIRHRRRKRGVCPSCGYNLTGNTSGVCPECGTPTAAGVKA